MAAYLPLFSLVLILKGRLKITYSVKGKFFGCTDMEVPVTKKFAIKYVQLMGHF